MDIRIFFTIFFTIFIAELGDKTQLATLLFSADKQVSKIGVFCAAALALIVSTGIGVIAGGYTANFINRRVLSVIAGTGLIVMGIWTITKA